MSEVEEPDTNAEKPPIETLIGLATKGKFSRAIKLAETLRAEKPKDKQIAAWLGYCLTVTGRIERGHELLEASVYSRIHTIIPRIYYLRSLICERSNKVREVHARLAGKVPVIERNFISIDSPTPLGQAYAAEVAKAAAIRAEVPDLFVFHHLPFTGGTSVQAALSLAYRKDCFFNIRRRSGLKNIRKFNELSDSEFAHIRYIHLHHPYPLETRGRRQACFTVLRDPVSYFLSGYYKRRNLGSKIIASRDMLIKGGGLPEAVEFARKHHLHNGLSKQLAVLHPDFKKTFARFYQPRRTLKDLVTGKDARDPHLDYVAYEEDLFYPKATARLPDKDLQDLAIDVLDNFFCQPGVIKHLDASFLAAMARLGHEVSPRMPHRGASHRPPRESIAPEVKERIAELNQVDQAIYDRTLKAFERDHADLIAAIAAEG